MQNLEFSSIIFIFIQRRQAAIAWKENFSVLLEFAYSPIIETTA